MIHYACQHDFHMTDWFKAKFNLTVQDNEHAYGRKEWWTAFKGGYDLDCKIVTGGPSVFDAALEYCSCYDGAMFDKLISIELGEYIGECLKMTDKERTEVYAKAVSTLMGVKS